MAARDTSLAARDPAPQLDPDEAGLQPDMDPDHKLDRLSGHKRLNHGLGGVVAIRDLEPQNRKVDDGPFNPDDPTVPGIGGR